MQQTLYDRQLSNYREAFKPLESYLMDKEVTDFYINGDGSFFVKRFKMEKRREDKTFTKEEVLLLITYAASMLQTVIHKDKPNLAGVIPYYNARIQAFIPPVVKSPSLVIRRINEKVIDLAQWEQEGRITLNQYEYLVRKLSEKTNFLIGGATGSGKTFFLNSLIKQMNLLNLRLFIAGDAGELICERSDYVALVVEADQTAEAIRSALRSYIDRIIFEELRRRETAVELLDAWNTDHYGAATIHANSAATMLDRYQDLLTDNLESVPLRKKLARTINVLIHFEDQKGFGPKVTKILEVLPQLDVHNQWQYKTII